MNGIKKEELIIMLKYAYFMTRVMLPAKARSVGLYNFDGSISDFYRNIITSLEKDENIDISKDEFYSVVYEDMKEDINGRNIEYDDFIILSGN